MQNTLLVGLSRQVSLSRELDVVANNLANINTNGFKTSGALFEEFIAPNARASAASSRDSRVSFVRDRATWLDLSQGPMERTGNPLDVAIDGKAFFAVQTPNGERYTRSGAFQVNAQGQLVTNEGFQVLGENGPVVFQPTDRDIKISGDGTISVGQGAVTNTEALRGKLRLTNFDAPGKLQKDGAGTFSAPAGVQQVAIDRNTKLVQGSIEKSNVRSVVEMTRMIEITRAYTQVASMIQQQADLQRSAVEKLAEVPN